MIFKKNVENFIKELQSFEKMENVFNPWQDDGDKEHDLDEDSPKKRAENLRVYLLARENAKYVLIAEAPGYQGCHFSGIPMTSERLILAPNNYGLGNLSRTSNKKHRYKTVQEYGYCEPTATIVWKQMVDELGLKPTDFVLWNAFPFHPYKDHILTNRKPEKEELKKAAHILNAFIKLFPNAYYISIGGVSKEALTEIKGIKYDSYKQSVIHPSYGHAAEFRKRITEIINSNFKKI